jgi:hypothetical protein
MLGRQYVSRNSSRNKQVAGVHQEPATGAHPQEKLLSQTYKEKYLKSETRWYGHK